MSGHIILFAYYIPAHNRKKNILKKRTLQNIQNESTTKIVISDQQLKQNYSFSLFHIIVYSYVIYIYILYDWLVDANIQYL